MVRCIVIVLICSLAVNLYLLIYLKFDSTFKNPTSSTEPAKPKHLSQNDTIILIWFWPFNKRFELKSCCSKFQIEGCHLTDDRALYKKAHGVLIHHRDIRSDLSNLPSEPRPYFQKWVWMHFESPKNTPRIAGLENLFNVTMNYRRDADISIHEQMILKTEDTKDEIFPEVLKKKNKLVCWIISNWNEEHDRVKYYNELKKHIHIELYGRRFGRALSQEGYNNVLTECKFYLSFENTKYIDYMTEKLYNPLTKGSVPVVLGPPKFIYERLLPSDSFIHVDDFKTHKELADYLLSLDKNEDQYKKFFQWREKYKVKHVDFPREHACLACHYIRNRNDYQVFTNLNKWYWDLGH
ncbi:4-galactosyl-N-acetylglucosaminide 3-alpha-L-fucosyltransferase 9 isoform X1 [Colossoma macropomum]|uniref:4-galactosyl-N-acetylglucosaminide 3-alpha-L-fucosyltransferase 9 isoform X1 n=1 Tax=Colossoma macropomum TaxID=42526 RepID=UPI0018648C4D|nr:4-galactosyl-N-acetylglucosaminide 3-alpha-L-fucosyltransferase 9 isoform X1 [Colossoma macropomum]